MDTAAILNDEVLSEPCKLIAVTHSKLKPTDRIGHLLGRKDIRFMALDVSKPFKIPKEVTYLVHGASAASPKKYLEKPIETMDSNVNCLRTMLDFSLKNKVKSILYISTAEIYGNPPPEAVPIREDYNGNVSCTSDRSCYTESKRYCEALCRQFYLVHRTPVKCARPFHNYGPGLRLDDGRAIADFMSDALRGGPIHVKSTGKTLMTYCYVADTAEAFWRILLSDANGESFNAGSGGPEFTVLELAERVASLFKPKLKVSVEPDSEKPYQKESPKRTCADITKINTMLSWKPDTKFDDGLSRALAWYSSRRGSR